MLVISDIDGLTQGTHVFRKGDVFVLDQKMAKSIAGKNDLQTEMWQKQIYGRRLFRRASDDEILMAFKKKKVTLDMMEPKERELMLIRIKDVSERKARLVDQLMETVDEDDIKIPEESKKAPKGVPVEDESPVTVEPTADESEVTFEDSSLDDLLGETKKGTSKKSGK